MLRLGIKGGRYTSQLRPLGLQNHNPILYQPLRIRNFSSTPTNRTLNLNMRTESWKKSYKFHVDLDTIQFVHNDKIVEDIPIERIESVALFHECFGQAGDTYQWVFMLDNLEEAIVLPMDAYVLHHDKLEKFIFDLPGFDNRTFAYAMTNRKNTTLGNKMAFKLWQRPPSVYQIHHKKTHTE